MTDFSNDAGTGVVTADGFDGPISGVSGITAVATADGSDAATTQALANALKAKLNELIAALQA